jgi:uncharacterized protein
VADASETLNPTGVGVLYSGALAALLSDHPDWVDVISLIPETLWHESGYKYTWIQEAAALFDDVTNAHDIVFHGIGLSLGSAGPVAEAHLDQLEEAAARYRPKWFSEHLAAFRIRAQTGPEHAGVGLPIAFDREMLNLIAPKVAALRQRLGVPVLLENSAVYVPIPGSEWTEAGLLNRICEITGSGVLLDLHNLVVNERNLGWSADAFLDELDAASIVEVHVAGGESIGRWYTDAHSGACPERVWQLLDRVADDSVELRSVTFEIHDSRCEALGAVGLQGQLSRIRESLSARLRHVS